MSSLAFSLGIRYWRWIVAAVFALLILFFFFFSGLSTNSNQSPYGITGESQGLSPSVSRYEPLLSDALKQEGLDTSNLPVLLAIMQQESRGEGGDPMQSSESMGKPPGWITDPVLSIQQGVRHYKSVLAYATEHHVDTATIIQSYNMGRGYIDYVSAHGGSHSEALAREYSLLQVSLHPGEFTCGGNTHNFRYPACYGDFTYTGKVMRYIAIEQSPSVPAVGDPVFQTVMAEGLKFRNWSYQWGGADPSTSFDCSGLTQWVFRKAGIALPRTAAEQWNATVAVTDPKPGDLVFFETYKAGPSHVGIYVGNRQFYNSNSGGIRYDSLDNSYWKKTFLGFRRIRG